MKHIILSIQLILFLVLTAIAQDAIHEKAKPTKNEQSVPLSEKIYFGGGLGLSFGSYTRLAIYPLVGVRVTDKFRSGIQFGYEYISDKRYSPNFEASNYGAGLFAQYNIFPQLYVHLEPAIYNYEAYYIVNKDRVWVPYLYVGGGLAQPIGGNAFMYAQIKFDLIQDINSPYSSWAPMYDVGVRVGF